MLSRAAVVGTTLVAALAVPPPALADDPPPPVPVVFDGTVTVAGQPQAGATVRLTDGVNPAVETTTDELGHYHVEVPSGSYLVCAGMTDNSVHHSCTPGSALGTDAPTFTVADGDQQTLDYTLEASDHPLGSDLAPSSAAWVPSGKRYRLVYSAGPVVYRPAKSVSQVDVALDAVRTFNGAESRFLVGSRRIPGFAKYPRWGTVEPLPALVLEPTVFDEKSCGLPADQGAGRPAQMWAVPKIVEQVRNAHRGAVLLQRETPVDESACRRDRLTLAVKGVIRDRRRQIRLSARTDSAVQAYRPMVRIYRSSGTLLGKRRLRVDGSIRPVLLPKKFHKRKLAVRIVLPPSDGSPRFAVRRTIAFPKR